MAKDITLKTRNGETRYPKSVTALIYENGTGKTLQTIIDEMRQVDTQTDTRTQHFKADVNNLDTLKNKTDIGLYNYVGTGWRGSVSVCYDSADNVSQVALSSSTPSYNGNTLTWLSAQPCAMARTYTNGAWSHWEKVGAPVVNDLTTGGTDKALSAEMGKTLKEGLDALGPKISKAALTQAGARGDLDVSDTSGKVIVRFQNGHVITRDFNSANVYTKTQVDDMLSEFEPSSSNDTWLKGKTVAILGDSISTNGDSGTDSNTPEILITSQDVGVSLSAYLTYRDVNYTHLALGGHTFTTSEIGTEVTFTPTSNDVGKKIGLPNNYNANSVKTWWEVAAEALGFIPIPACWSGSSITSHDMENSYNTGSNLHKMDCSYAWHPSQIRKCGVRTPGSMTRTAPDVIIIYRGTNDFSHAVNVKLTEGFFDSPNFTIPSTDKIDNTYYGYKEGLVITVTRLRAAYPSAIIFLCTMNVFKRINYETWPVNNGFNTLPQWNNAIREVADYMGCGLIDFDKDGITFENCYPTYINDSATIPTHPNDAGHLMMGRKAIADLCNFLSL